MMTDFSKFQNEKNILSHPDIQQNMMILMGGGKEKEQELTQEQQKQITRNYIAMYFALGAVNWCQGTTLGVAWQKALNQMDSFVESKTKIANHPMSQYLAKIHAQHRREMSKAIMTSPYANYKLMISPELAKGWSDFATKHFQENKNALNGLYNKLMPNQKLEKQSENNPFKMAQDKMCNKMQSIWLQHKLNQYAA